MSVLFIEKYSVKLEEKDKKTKRFLSHTFNIYYTEKYRNNRRVKIQEFSYSNNGQITPVRGFRYRKQHLRDGRYNS